MRARASSRESARSSSSPTRCSGFRALNDRAHGITVNVGTIDGGLRPNVVAPEATAVVDVRVPTAAARGGVEAAIRSPRSCPRRAPDRGRGRVRAGADGTAPRNRVLLAAAMRLGRELELATRGRRARRRRLRTPNTTSLSTATLDGLGPVGEGSHASTSTSTSETRPERAALLALLLLEPARESPFGSCEVDEPRVIIAAAGDNETDGSRGRVARARHRQRARPTTPATGSAPSGRHRARTTRCSCQRWTASSPDCSSYFASSGAASACSIRHPRCSVPTTSCAPHANWIRAGLPHPHTQHDVKAGEKTPSTHAPVVVKPRFESGARCLPLRKERPAELTRCLRRRFARKTAGSDAWRA